MIEIYADGADLNGILKAAKYENITGFTTNPTLMKAAGITSYEEFSLDVIKQLSVLRPKTNISLEVFADDFEEMYQQAKKISYWGSMYNYDVFVKIPVMNTKGIGNYELIKKLNEENIKINVTAVFTPEQTYSVLKNIKNEKVPVIISIFSGRIADTLRDPILYTRACVNEKTKINSNFENVKFLWASCREPFHLEMAKEAGCDIITMPFDQIKKLDLKGKDLIEFSQETVKMFYNDAVASNYRIDV